MIINYFYTLLEVSRARNNHYCVFPVFICWFDVSERV